MRFLLLLALLAGCSTPAPQPPDDDDSAEEPCVIPLRTVSYGDTDRYFLDVQIDGGVEVWQLDTGSGLTFRYEGDGAPSYTPDLGELNAGCGSFPFAGRNLTAVAGGPGGAEIAGLVGMDFLLDQPMVLEFDALRLLHLKAEPDWPDAVVVPFDELDSHALVPASIDGAAVRLLFDTGGGHTLWVGEDGRPGDDVQQVQDAQGTIFPIYVGTGELTLGPLTRDVPVARAPEFPYFGQTVDALGGNLHGLLGVTAFPGEALYFDRADRTLRVRALAE